MITKFQQKTARGSDVLFIDGNELQLSDIENVARHSQPVKLSPSAYKQLESSRAVIERIVDTGEIVYGVTTGFGKFKDVFIKPEDSRTLQRNLLLSHAACVGPLLSTEVVRGMLLLRANALAKGYSGVRTLLVDHLLELLNHGIHPCVPEQGSLGASGDLAPLAHLALVLIGEGTAEYDGEVHSGAQALAKAGLAPIHLEAKEGLALTNGTQMMASLGTLILLEAERLATVADIIGIMSLEALLGSGRAFNAQIHAIRPHPGQIASASNLRKLLEHSSIVESHANCPMVQDAYSLRCMPQVHGASRQAFAHARQVLEIEVNSATDNPLVFEEGTLLGGNFHGQPLALVLDYMSMALAELANISERRTERLVNPALSNGLPPFLTSFGGLNSGYMIGQYTAAALVSENKSLAHPASVDSIPTSANQEDHVSMGATAARQARSILNNVRNVLAIELLCATQGLDFRMQSSTEYGAACEHSGEVELAPGPGVAAAHKLVREHIPHLNEDRELHLDIVKAEQLIASGQLLTVVKQTLGDLV